MSKRILSGEQLKVLTKNKNVQRCSSKSIRYKKGFKEKALDLYNKEGLAAVEIFESAGFDLDVIGKRTPNKLMNQWNDSLKPKSAILRQIVKPKISEKVRRENNTRRLKNRIAYLEAENDFLEKLRAGKRK